MQNEKLHTTTCPGNQPNEELYRFGADGNLRMYSYDRLFFSLYGYDAGTTRTYKYSMDLSPNWVNGRLEAVNFNMHNAMFYPNSYLNFNSNGYYTKHYYNGMERIASKLGDQNLPINVNDPELQDRKDWQDSLIRKNIVEITGYEFLEPGEEQTLEDPKPVFELPVIGISNLQPSSDGIYYYHSNHLGSTCYVTDENAIVQQGFLYAPFGEITNEHNVGWQSGTLPKYSFNAKELDEETGMYYYEARYYQPPVFTSRDPLFEKYPSISPYAYCANNPIMFIDPDGRDWYKAEDGSIQYTTKYVSKEQFEKSGIKGDYLGKTKTIGNTYYSLFGQKINIKNNRKNAEITQKIDQDMILFAKFQEEHNNYKWSIYNQEGPTQGETDFRIPSIKFEGNWGTQSENIHGPNEMGTYAGMADIYYYVNGSAKNMLAKFYDWKGSTSITGNNGNYSTPKFKDGQRPYLTFRNNIDREGVIVALNFHSDVNRKKFETKFYVLFPKSKPKK